MTDYFINQVGGDLLQHVQPLHPGGRRNGTWKSALPVNLLYQFVTLEFVFINRPHVGQPDHQRMHPCIYEASSSTNKEGGPWKIKVCTSTERHLAIAIIHASKFSNLIVHHPSKASIEREKEAPFSWLGFLLQDLQHQFFSTNLIKYQRPTLRSVRYQF